MVNCLLKYLLCDWFHQMVIGSTENFSNTLAHSHVALRIEKDLCRFVHFSDCKFSIKHDHTFVHDIKLSAEQVVISQDTLQVLNIEENRAYQTTHVP